MCHSYSDGGWRQDLHLTRSSEGRLKRLVMSRPQSLGRSDEKTRTEESAREKERARTSERLERLVARCGPAFHLVPDTLLVVKNILDHYPPALQAFNSSKELRASVLWLMSEPLMTALQGSRAAAAECRHCQPAEPLKARYFNLSGSSAECLFDLMIDKEGTSDFDIMFEFGGPLGWAEAAVAGEEPGCISPEAAPQLWAKPTGSPGFVRLYWSRTSRCSHEGPLEALPANEVRRLMWYCCRIGASPDAEIDCSGPAVNIRLADDKTGGIDHVPCLRLPWWPEEDVFLSRRRVTDFPPAAARRDICQFGVHVVPTGRPGSDTEDSEYQVSFSRAEVVAIRHLSPVQHETIRTTKGMKNILKDSGATPGIKLKSYYIKTAVLWLAQDRLSDRWTGVTEGVHMVLNWLEHRLGAGSIPCFFWPAINLVAGLEKADLEDMIRTVRLMRNQAARLLMAHCDRLGYALDSLLEGGPEPLSERELRLRVARHLVFGAVLDGVRHRPTAPCWEYWFRESIPASPGRPVTAPAAAVGIPALLGRTPPAVLPAAGPVCGPG